MIIGYTVYYPGLSGPFLFDDFPNLRALGLNGGVADWETLQSYVFGGFSGPTGRPISLLTFLLNSNVWPADPSGFKYTNVLLHLLNGTLLFALTLKIMQVGVCVTYQRGVWVALLTAGLWLLHPYLTSTTLYVIQRMAMLATTFCFTGMLVYLYGRTRICVNPLKAYSCMTLGIGVGTVLATFSKENGAVLVLLILCLEVTIVSANPEMPRLNRLWKWVALILPSVALAVLLLKGPFLGNWFNDYSNRDFSPYERVMTQFRVVLSYLHNWFAPSSAGGQIFYDELSVSRGFFSPITTFLSAITVIGSISFAVFMRKSRPVVSFVILFYFASLCVESTTIGLEMKFDHRIYLGSAFLFLPLILWGADYLRPPFKTILSLILVGVMAAFTYSASNLWGDYQKLTMVWAVKKPDSVRSQTEAASMLFSSGQGLEARKLLDDAAERIPGDFRLRLTQVLVQCMTGSVKAEDMAEVMSLSESGPYRYTDFGLLNSLLTSASSNECNGISDDDVVAITQKLLNSSSHKSPESLAYAHLHYYHGLALLRVGAKEKALAMLNKALESRSSLHMRMNIAAYKANAGLYKQALEDARYVRERLRFDDLTGRAAIESPPLEQVEHFIHVVRSDISVSEGAVKD
ncbi:tetratricopeptide repeat protein [Marinobacter halotolerans]|uniref:tetratricopeptide repeat protein n=1 Tax=Marinobacter halotolerans TaxID=1569211 RepID=UPI001243C1D7|nr:tetratricopeptide repeat protein [Marinobacter halotolerans]